MQTASEQHTVCGTTSISLIQRSEARQYRSTYRYARNALQRLPVDRDYLKTLKDITEDNIKVAGDITDENQFGQRSDTLPWFWQISSLDDSNGLRMQECGCTVFYFATYLICAQFIA
jgi:hypothetical protein